METAESQESRPARPPVISSKVTAGLTALGLAAAIAWAALGPASPRAAVIFMITWLVVSVAVTWWLTPRDFIAGYLIGLFAMLVGWRIAGLDHFTWPAFALIPAFIAFVAQFFGHARGDWRLTLLRIYVGFDMVPHFTEKLFAGAAPFMDDVKGFAGFGLAMPAAFVIVGGLCELGVAIGVGMGLFTRLAGVCAALYFLVATLIGGHFHMGFIWASDGGGWEYPVLMMVLFLTFAVRGGGAFSLDQVLIDTGRMPSALRRLAAPKT